MNSFINKVLSASVVFGLVVVMGVIGVLAEYDNNAGIHIPAREIVVYSPITDMLDCETDVNVHSLFSLAGQDTARIHPFDMNRVQCEDALAEHQQQIDNILALICEHSINNLQDLSALLQTLQSEVSHTPEVTNACADGCVLVPVWVTIGGVRYPGFMCINCGRVIFTS